MRSGGTEGADPQDTLRTAERREQRLGSYKLFQRSGPIQSGMWRKIMRGPSTRKYRAAVKEFHNAYAIEKSEVSENFIEASRAHRSKSRWNVRWASCACARS
jgi:hypothetical protein